MKRQFVLAAVLVGGVIFGRLYEPVLGVEGGPSRPIVKSNDSISKQIVPDKLDVKNSSTGRLREGSKLVDQIGEFQKSGERISFFSKDGHGLRVLENQSLERVARVLDDNPSQRIWNISGVITEYRGENYLLLTRAVLKARTDSTVSGVPSAPVLGKNPQ